MKRVIPILLALLLVILTACSAEDPASSKSKKSSSKSEKSTSEPLSAEAEPEPSDAPADETAPDETPLDKTALDEIQLPQLGRSGAVEDLTPEQRLAYNIKYIEPYYITGLMHKTWSDPEEIEVEYYMTFYVYNESTHYWAEHPSTDHRAIPAEVVEAYITSYFEVDPSYLRTAENYDAANGSYRSMFTEGIGGGPGVVIKRIEENENTWKFICGGGENGDRPCSVTIEERNMGKFRYIAGEGMSVQEPASSRTDDQFDAMALGDHAQVLTQHIADTVFEYRDIAAGDCPPPSEARFTAFAMGVVEYLENEAYQYHDIAYREGGYWHFQEDRLKGMVEEVFGAGDWEPNWGPDRETWPLERNEESREYIADLAFDFWTHMECRFMATVVDPQNEVVIVDYDLYSSSLFPDQHKIAFLSTNYSIRLREDGTPYLRYEGTVVQSLSQ